MAALTSLSDLVNRQTGGNSGTPENIHSWKGPTHSNGSADSWLGGAFYSAWRYDGFPGYGSAPGAVAVPTNSTNGALPITNAGGGRDKWLVGAVCACSAQNVGFVKLYDRLLHISGLSGTSTSVQNVQSGSGVVLTRNTGGDGNEIWVEINTEVGSTERTLTITYTNSAATGGQTTTIQLGGSADTLTNDTNLMIPVPLAAGDKGVQSVESVQLNLSTGTAGDFGIVIANPLGTFNPPGGAGNTRSFANGMPGLPLIETNACLATAFGAASTTEVPWWLSLAFVEA